jgi:hypothetical protein
MQINHVASAAFNGNLTASAHAASTMRQLSTIYLCNGLGVNCIWRTRLGAIIRGTGWSLRCNTQGVGWRDKSSSIRYAAWVVTVKVYKWSGFTLDDSCCPWRLRNVMNLLTRQDQNGISWNWNSNRSFCVCNINMHISTEGHLEWAFGNNTLSQVDAHVDHWELQLSTGTGR